MMSMVANARRVIYPPRSCALVDGYAKVAYPTRRAAARVRRILRVLDQRPYACPTCGMWHLGHRWGRR